MAGPLLHYRGNNDMSQLFVWKPFSKDSERPASPQAQPLHSTDPRGVQMVPPVLNAGPWGSPWGWAEWAEERPQLPNPTAWLTGRAGTLLPPPAWHFQLLASLIAPHSHPPWRLQAHSRAVTPEPTASATPARLCVPPVPAPSSVIPTTPQQGHPQPPACLTGLAGGTRLRTQDGAQKGRGAEANTVTAFARRWHESIILTRCAQPQALRDGCPCCSQGRALEDTGHPDALKTT